MATVLTVQGMGIPTAVLAADKPAVMSSDSDTQMSSEKENVYVNQYGSTTERSQNFDDNWRFYLGDASGAEQPTFDDSQWRQLSLPHDYSIEQEYTQSGEAESAYLLGEPVGTVRTLHSAKRWRARKFGSILAVFI